MKVSMTNPYGYKVCYQEKAKKQIIRHFITHTYKQAKDIKRHYLLYPPLSRIDNHVLKKPTWFIIPISKREVRDGIWRECPF